MQHAEAGPAHCPPHGCRPFQLRHPSLRQAIARGCTLARSLPMPAITHPCCIFIFRQPRHGRHTRCGLHGVLPPCVTRVHARSLGWLRDRAFMHHDTHPHTNTIVTTRLSHPIPTSQSPCTTCVVERGICAMLPNCAHATAIIAPVPSTLSCARSRAGRLRGGCKHGIFTTAWW